MLELPPYGRTNRHYCGDVWVLIWEPGTGLRYVMHAAPLGAPLDAVLGGKMLVSLSSMADRTFVSYALTPATTGCWTREYVLRTWRRLSGIVDHAAHWAMLLNWTLGGDRARAYAEGLWQSAHGEVGGKVVSIHEAARRIHRRSGADP